MITPQFIDITILIIFNLLIPREKRIPKKIIRDSIFIGGIILLWIWVVSLFFIYYYFFMDIYQNVIPDIIFTIIYSIILFIVGTFITRWRSGKKGFNNSLSKAVILNLLLFIINVAVGILFVFLFGDSLLNNTLILFIDIAIGSAIVMKLYSRELRPSLNFMFVVALITFLLSFIIEFILKSFLTIVQDYDFYVKDVRAHLIIDIFIYLVFFAVILKVKYHPELFKKEMRIFPESLPKAMEPKIKESRKEGKKVILDVKNLTTYFYSEEGVVHAVEDVAFEIHQGEVLGLVGETGCGKSVTALSILQLIRSPGKIEKGSVKFGDVDLLKSAENEVLPYRGNEITMIFQDPLNSLNPVYRVGKQITEVYLLHKEEELLLEAVKEGNKSSGAANFIF